MTAKEFLASLAHGRKDIVQLVLDILREGDVSYCVIDGLAVNAYVEPVVSLDLDIVIVGEEVESVCREAVSRGLTAERFAHSINLRSQESDLRVQLQSDERHQEFISRAQVKNVIGYEMSVATLEDVLAGKIWAYSDKARRSSKRQKDLADIARLVEAFPHLGSQLPEQIRRALT
jgi:hypothetical protein